MTESAIVSEALDASADDDLKPSDGDNARASWNLSAELLRPNMAHFAPDEIEALVSLFNWCTDERHPLSMAEAGARLECSAGLIYQLLTGKYRNPDKSKKGPSKEFMRRLNAFLELEARKYAAAGLAFVETETAKKCFLACDLARESYSPVFLEGPSHVGKTWALRRWTSDPKNGPHFMVEIVGPGKTSLVRTTARAFALSGKFTELDRLLQSIRHRITPKTVLVFDEVHLLDLARRDKFFQCIEWLRRLYDACQCGIVLSFTRLKDINDEALIQLRRRCTHHIRLPAMPTKADIGAILHHNGFAGAPVLDGDRKVIGNTVFPPSDLIITLGKSTGTPYEILRDQAARNGLKSITERIRYARKLADKGTGKIGWSHFVDAHLRIEKQAVQQGEWN